MWLLNHECQSMDALECARMKLAQGDPRGAKIAIVDSFREMKMGGLEFFTSQEQRLESLNLEIDEAVRLKEEAEFRFQHSTSGYAALQRARDLLSSLNVLEFQREFERTLAQAAVAAVEDTQDFDSSARK